MTNGCTLDIYRPVISTFAGFDWDAANRAKCQKHGVSIAAIESMFTRPVAVFADDAHSDMEERFTAIGQSDEGRGVLIVFTLRVTDGSTLIRPISARYMHRKEIAYYEEAASSSRQ